MAKNKGPHPWVNRRELNLLYAIVILACIFMLISLPKLSLKAELQSAMKNWYLLPPPPPWIARSHSLSRFLPTPVLSSTPSIWTVLNILMYNAELLVLQST